MADEHRERVGAAIRERRKELGLSQRALAAKIPVTEKTLARWEKGQSFGHMSNLEKVAEELDTTVDALMTGPRDAKRQDTPSLLDTLGGAAPASGDELRTQLDRIEHNQATIWRAINALLTHFEIQIALRDADRALLEEPGSESGPGRSQAA